MTNDQLSSPIKILKLKSLSYNRFFPSERMMEIILECDTINVLDKIDGILLNYKHATRMLGDDIFISTYRQKEGSRLQESFLSMSNSKVDIMEGSILLLEKSIWTRQTSSARTENDEVLFTVDKRIAIKNMITNGLDLNNIRNSLL